MGTYQVEFTTYVTLVRSVPSAAEAMRVAEDRGNELYGSDSKPVRAQQMREVYMGGGYCLIPIGEPAEAA